MAIDEKAVFVAAMALPDSNAREAYLREACAGDPELLGRMQELLAAHEESRGPLDRQLPELGGTVDLTSAEAPGTKVGPYKLIEQVGEGGMGTVWMAQQTQPVKRLVALKLVKAGMDSKQFIARFEAERQALALMDHPNIARVYDAGTMDAGRPYFVMELVKGVPITKYCDSHRLTPRQRLELFVPVCHAVQHAHQKGVIHRDLKPSNVLVALYDGRPMPKVIDFGVAKAAGQSLTDKTLVTGFGSIVGTLEYMSPEQAEINQLDIDTRSDIYSLGVLLYELLTGSPPFTKKELEKVGVLEMLRVIREQEPSKPSTKLSTADGLPTLAANRATEPAKLTRLVRGELDWIVMKALEKDRNRRYETANGFAMDVQRYLADEPVLACPPSMRYRLRKLVRRHKVRLSMVALAAACGLVLLGVGFWLLWQRSSALRDAESAFTIAEEAQKRRDRPAARAALAQAEGHLPKWGAGRVAGRIERLKADIDVLDLIDELRLEPITDPKIGKKLPGWDAGYAEAFRRLGVDPDADGPEKAAEQLRTHAGVPELAATLDDWAWVRRKHLNEGEARWKPLLETARLADDDATRNRVREAAAAGDWASVRRIADSIDLAAHPPLSLSTIGHYLAEADEDYRPVLAFLRRARLQYPDDFWINTSLAEQLRKPMRRETNAEMIGCYSAALVIRPHSMGTLFNLGNAYVYGGIFDEGISICNRILAMNISDFDRVRALQMIATACKEKGDVDRALSAIDEAIRINPKEGSSHHHRGMILLKLDPAAALVEGQAVVQLSSGDIVATGLGHELIALAYANQRQFDQAAASLREALRQGRHYPASEAIMRDELGHVLLDLHDYEGALAEFEAAINIEPDFLKYQFHAVKALSGLKRYSEARAKCERFLERDSVLAEVFNDLASIYEDEGKLAQAEGAYRASAVLDRKQPTALYNLGLLLNKSRRHDEAARAFRAAIVIEPNLASFHCDLAVALELSGKKEESLKEARTALALCDKDRSAYKPGCYLQLGNGLKVNGNFAAAADAYLEAIHLKPDFAEAYDNLGGALAAQNKLTDAIAAYRKGLELNKDLPHVRGNLALSLINDGRPAEALPLLEEAIRRNPQDVRCLGMLGMVKNRLRDLGGAEAALRRAIQLAPSFGPAHSELGFVLRRQGRFTESLVEFELGQASGSRSAEGIQLLRDARRMVELDAKLPAVLKGELKPRDDRERIDYGTVAKSRKQFAAAARLYAEALANEPALGQSLELSHRYSAACYAALAGTGHGDDVGALDAKERARLRNQALTWLRADLATWQERLAKEPDKTRPVLSASLRHWQQDVDLTDVRETEAIKRWPEVERRDWQQLWDEVDGMLRRTTENKK
jgi:serine/threonine protein kinase/tetratricopeptide (TPR) repeat protein